MLVAMARTTQAWEPLDAPSRWDTPAGYRRPTGVLVSNPAHRDRSLQQSNTSEFSSQERPVDAHTRACHPGK